MECNNKKTRCENTYSKNLNGRKKTKMNNKLKIVILLIVLAMSSLFVFLVNYKNKINNYQASEIQEYQAKTYSNEYKKHSELTDADLTDEYQQNYQK